LTGGMFSMIHSEPVIIVAKTIGRAAFFMPLIFTEPFNGLPPLIEILFISTFL